MDHFAKWCILLSYFSKQNAIVFVGSLDCGAKIGKIALEKLSKISLHPMTFWGIFNTYVHMHFRKILRPPTSFFVYGQRPTIQWPDLKLSYTETINVVSDIGSWVSNVFVYDNLSNGRWIVGKHEYWHWYMNQKILQKWSCLWI